jgi:cell division protein FtsB
MTLRRMALYVVHAVFAIIVVSMLYGQHDERAQSVARIKATADQERAETERMRRDNEVLHGLLKGLRASDPYVVEMLARDKLRCTRPGEIAPPPSIDKPSDAAPK